ncbi:hypothetical protein NGG16_17930 [Enterococcus casseliflavus]|uniref:hypothetical protein n=1 Tax=Enterococcus casseliflavus TaxID=37734 RepID=UPI002DBF7C16|nr:hypothetical protein [Enterococcus casseliflavus]MEB8419311.1 hypothetical protein [Enterococcus casseliflavus]
MELVDVYEKKTYLYIASFEKSNKNIINYIANIQPHQSLLLVDCVTDNTLLTTV